MLADVGREIDRQWGLERWEAKDSIRTCRGCAFLDGRVFFAFEGPRPELHPDCRCTRVPVSTDRLAGVELIRLVLEARANGRAADFLEQEAKRLRLAPRVPRRERPARDRLGRYASRRVGHV